MCIAARKENRASCGNTVWVCYFFVIVTKDPGKTVSWRKALGCLIISEVPFHHDGEGVTEPSSSPHGDPEADRGCLYSQTISSLFFMHSFQITVWHMFRMGLFFVKLFWNHAYKKTHRCALVFPLGHPNPFSLKRFISGLGDGKNG